MRLENRSSWGGSRFLHYCLFIGSPFLFMSIISDSVLFSHWWGIPARTIGGILLSHLIGSVLLFAITYCLFVVYYCCALKGGQKLVIITILIILFLVGYHLLLLENSEPWSMIFIRFFLSFFMGFIGFMMGIIPATMTALSSDLFKVIYRKFAEKRGCYYWAISTILFGVSFSGMYGFLLRGAEDVWFFIDISLFCTSYSIFVIFLRDFFSRKNSTKVMENIGD